ncbi:LigA [Anaeromyxobacter sp. Fw109-5]|nr:LigA [Anaeromyxobacter sp. Fw109-5]
MLRPSPVESTSKDRAPCVAPPARARGPTHSLTRCAVCSTTPAWRALAARGERTGFPTGAAEYSGELGWRATCTAGTSAAAHGGAGERMHDAQPEAGERDPVHRSSVAPRRELGDAAPTRGSRPRGSRPRRAGRARHRARHAGGRSRGSPPRGGRGVRPGRPRPRRRLGVHRRHHLGARPRAVEQRPGVHAARFSERRFAERDVRPAGRSRSRSSRTWTAAHAAVATVVRAFRAGCAARRAPSGACRSAAARLAHER